MDGLTVGLRTGRGLRLLSAVESRLCNAETRPRYQPGTTDENKTNFAKRKNLKTDF